MAVRASLADQGFMLEALRQARRPRSLPYPNPWVGCVIVRNARIVGRGFHRGPGSSHAEAAALAEAGALARGATLYVNLEPCCHYGRTPPCSSAILAAGIDRVVYAIPDPNPLVATRSAALLSQRGVSMTSGVCAEEAASLNEVYLKFRATGLPFVTAKVAASLDGKTATRTGESRWITGAAARLRGRQLRARHQAVLVGIRTVLADDPHLGPRIPGAPDPWRVVMDSSLRVPLQARLLKTRRCIIACTRAAPMRKRAELEQLGSRVWSFSGKRVPVDGLLRRLAGEGILSVLVEGGSEVVGSFLDRDAVDRLYWFTAPILLGSERSRSAVGGKGVATLRDAHKLRQISIRRVGTCWMVRARLSRWALG